MQPTTLSQLQAYRESSQYRHQQRPPRQAPSGLIPVLSGDEVFGVLGRKYFGYTADDGHMYKYLIKWKNQGDSSNQWALPNDIKRHGRRHPLLNKFDKEVPFINDELEPGSHTPLSDAKQDELFSRGNISIGITTEHAKSDRKRSRIPKRR